MLRSRNEWFWLLYLDTKHAAQSPVRLELAFEGNAGI